MNGNEKPRLILGGHTFIQPLGNEQAPSPEVQMQIVERCLDIGITWFDTTHQPERSALGRCLEELGRRQEATIIAWNFMKLLKPGDQLDRPVEFQPEHLQMMLEQLRTDCVDCLVLHELDDGTDSEHRRQEELAISWVESGRVKQLGVWSPDRDAVQKYGWDNPYSFMVKPYNVRNDAGAAFAAAKELGWQTFACSPFVRGWALDELVEGAKVSEVDPEPVIRKKISDLMLRWSLFQPNVDRVITAMRRPDWVESNARSSQKGPLDQEERAFLQSLLELESS